MIGKVPTEPNTNFRELYEYYRELVTGHIAELGAPNDGSFTGALAALDKLVAGLRPKPKVDLVAKLSEYRFRSPFEDLRQLGILWEKTEPDIATDSIHFIGCSDVPDVLPDGLTVLGKPLTKKE